MRVNEREREARFERMKKKGARIIFFFLFFAPSYRAHLSIDMQCSKSVKKNKYSSTAGACFLCMRS